jgi:hypothetical protein
MAYDARLYLIVQEINHPAQILPRLPPEIKT